MVNRFEKPRPAREADHGIVYRNEAEFCAWPFLGGLWRTADDSIVAAFGDLEAITADCPRGCSHETGAPECALDLAVERGELAPARLESFRRMLGSDH